jgi:hypothetical protein
LILGPRERNSEAHPVGWKIIGLESDLIFLRLINLSENDRKTGQSIRYPRRPVFSSWVKILFPWAARGVS